MSEYREFTDLLVRADAKTSAAACHGFLCGQVCGGDLPDEDLWMEFVDAQTPDDHVAESCCEELRTMTVAIERQLQSMELDFDLLLPEDGAPLGERVEALGEWCRGFLTGIRLLEDLSEESFSADSRELLEDFGAISNVGVEDDDEESEAALVHVVEYVRTGVMTLFMEARLQHTGARETWH